MQRRDFMAAGAALALMRVRPARALDLSESDAALGVREALQRGATAAVSKLGRSGGFLDNPKVRIPLPPGLDSAARALKLAGQGQRVEELVTAMNRAAEQAVPEARTLLVDAVRAMSVEDARRIVTGPDDSVTRFFATKTRSPLTERFLPIVTQATERVQLADKYNGVAGKAAKLGLVRREDANVQRYVTGKALDGLYLVIGEEERKIRRDPVGTGSEILKKVFGGLR